MALSRHKIKYYGWVADTPDQRDHLYAAPAVNLARLPPHVDLRPQCPKVVYDQGQLGSCTANTIGNAYRFDLLKQRKAAAFVPSRLFLYYNERSAAGQVDKDSGSTLINGVNAMVAKGVCSESSWPYDVARFAIKPAASCFRDAIRY